MKHYQKAWVSAWTLYALLFTSAVYLNEAKGYIIMGCVTLFILIMKLLHKILSTKV